MDDRLITDNTAAENRNRWYSSNLAPKLPTEPPRAIRALHNEHIYIGNLLDSIEEQLQLIDSGREVDFNFLIDIVDYLKNFPDRYHHPKEDLIFQRLALRDQSAMSEVQSLFEEHRALEVQIARVGESLEDYQLLPTVQKLKRIGELCSDYVRIMRRHIDREEAELLPRAVAALREEDWFLIEQHSTPVQEMPIEDTLVDNYTAIRRLLKVGAERSANTVVLAEFLGNHALLEVAGGLGATISHVRRSYRRGVKCGWRAYVVACKNWFPGGDAGPDRYRNPVRVSWREFSSGVMEKEGPKDVEMAIPVLRSLRLYATLMGGLANPQLD